ncbi:MAG: hypothetical protein ACK5LK_09160 [Chthoniobacterales bacterium]
MKTTIDLADDLAATFKKKISREGISKRAGVHEALRLWLKTKNTSSKRKTIPRNIGLMSGRGLSPEAASQSWDTLRAISYGQKS